MGSRSRTQTAKSSLDQMERPSRFRRDTSLHLRRAAAASFTDRRGQVGTRTVSGSWGQTLKEDIQADGSSSIIRKDNRRSRRRGNQAQDFKLTHRYREQQ